MKLIIAGSRTLNPSIEFILDAVDKLELPDDSPITTIVSGGAKGVDLAGEVFAREMSLEVIQFLPNYETYTSRAPLVRNAKMAAFADALLLIWDGSSRGSADMKNKMQLLNKPVYEVIVKR